MKTYIFLFGLVICFLCFAGQSEACNCSKPKSISDLIDYVHVFEGKVISVERKSENGIITEKVLFKVLKLIDGPKIEQIEVNFNYGRTSCDLELISFKLNEIYLISTNEYVEPKGRYFNNYCDLRIKLE